MNAGDLRNLCMKTGSHLSFKFLGIALIIDMKALKQNEVVMASYCPAN